MYVKLTAKLVRAMGRTQLNFFFSDLASIFFPSKLCNICATYNVARLLYFLPTSDTTRVKNIWPLERKLSFPFARMCAPDIPTPHVLKLLRAGVFKLVYRNILYLF